MTGTTTHATYYEASAPARPHRAAAAGDFRTDVCVIGGGLTGISAALELARRGYDVHVLEAERVGSGASGRNGGQINFGFSVDTAELDGAVGAGLARQLWPMAVEAVDLIDSRVAEHQIDCDLRRGFILAAAKARHVAGLRRDLDAMQNRYGYGSVEWLDRGAVAEVVGTDIYHGALRDPVSGHLHPLKYLLGLAEAAENLGAVIHENSPVRSVDPDSGEVRTAGAVVRADHVVLAANAYLDGLMPPLAARAMPVGTWVATTRPLSAEERAGLLPGGECVCDTRAALDYYRFTADGRLLFGGGVSYLGRDAPERAAALLGRRIGRVYPSLRDIGIEFAWGGRVSVTMNRMPDFGRKGRRLLYAQGFSGQGVALTGLAGLLMAEAVAGDAGRFDVFEGIRHRRFPGVDALRVPLLALGRFWYRLRDVL